MRPTAPLVTLLASLALPHAAWAGGTDPLQGVWKGRSVVAGGIEAQLTVNGDAGEWQLFPSSVQTQRDQCLRYVRPVRIDVVGEGRWNVVVDGEKVMPGCGLVPGTLQLEDAQTLTLQLDGRPPFKLKR